MHLSFVAMSALLAACVAWALLAPMHGFRTQNGRAPAALAATLQAVAGADTNISVISVVEAQVVRLLRGV